MKDLVYMMDLISEMVLIGILLITIPVWILPFGIYRLCK